MLELHAGKLARAVLRGRGGSNASPLPDPEEALGGEAKSPIHEGVVPGEGVAIASD
jgi:hypothetical protein